MFINYVIYIILGIVAILTLIKAIITKPQTGEPSSKRWIWILSMVISMLLLIVTVLKPPIADSRLAELEKKIDYLTDLINQMASSDKVSEQDRAEAREISQDIQNSGLNYSLEDSALVSIGLQNYSAALYQIDRLIRSPEIIKADRGKAFLLQSYAYILDDQPEKAGEPLDSAYNFLVDDFYVNTMRGRNYENRGELRAAEFNYNIAAMQKRNSPAAGENLSRIEMKIKDSAFYRAHRDTAQSEIDPNNP